MVGDGICFISIFKINEQISDHPSKDKAHISQNDFLWSFNNIKWRTPPTNDNKIFLLHRNSDVHTFNNKLSEDKISSLVQVFRFIGRGEIQASIESVRKLLKMIKIYNEFKIFFLCFKFVTFNNYLSNSLTLLRSTLCCSTVHLQYIFWILYIQGQGKAYLLRWMFIMHI